MAGQALVTLLSFFLLQPLQPVILSLCQKMPKIKDCKRFFHNNASLAPYFFFGCSMAAGPAHHPLASPWQVF
jgi:hypothetical protein